MEKAEKEESESRKRGGEERDRGGKRKKMRKGKFTLAEEDWGLAGGELETVEEREVAKERFSQVDKSWATVQTKIRIWTWLELEARKVTLECSVEAVARVEGWLEEEFKHTPEDWLDKHEMIPKG